MKLTSNMPRIISHAYSTNEPTIFLIKAGIYPQTKDTVILQKAYEIARIINSLVSKTTTDSENKFYSFTINAEEFERAMTRERMISDTLPVKEILIAAGVAYEECLEYMYISLSKYDPYTEIPAKVISSLDSTYNKLQIKTAQSKENLTEEELTTAIETIKELNSITSNLTQELANANSKIEELNNTVNTAKHKIEDTLLSGDIGADTELQAENLEVLYVAIEEGIKQQKKTLLKKQVITIVNSLDEKIKADTSKLENEAITHILSRIDLLERKIEDTDNYGYYSNIISKLNILDDFISNKAADRRVEIEMVDNTVDELYRTIQRSNRR